MKVAFSTWKKRVSPVFDVSGEICLLDIEPGGKINKVYKTLPRGLDRCIWLAREDVDVLVCGAISNHLQTRLEWMKIRVFPFITGDIEQVIKAWTGDSFKIENFAMPGCCCRFGNSVKNNKEVTDMRGRNQGQGGGGKGQGAGQCRNPRAGGVQGARFSGSAGVCTCPKCGHQSPHERGVPCMNMKCPQCGEIMRGRV